MNNLSILLLGAGGHARACADVIETEARYTIGGFVGLANEIGTPVLTYSVIGSDEDLAALLPKFSYGLVTVGQIKTPEARIRLFGLLKKHGSAASAIVSPHAYVSAHATVGEGSIVMHGAVINAGATVGANCIINSQALIEHDVAISDHCHIATGAVINGAVNVGAGTFIGSGSTVREGVRLGERCVIGMMQRILTDRAAGTHTPTPETAT